MTEQQITSLLLPMDYFDREKDVVWLPQQRMGCGFGNDFERTIDVFGISMCKPWTRFAVEIKLSKSDFQADIKQPMKQRRARMIANKFYYLAPEGLLAPDDMPLWAGLAVVKGEWIHIELEAPYMETSAPTWRFLAQIARRAARAGVGE